MLFVPGGGNRYRGVLQGGGGLWPSAILASRFKDRKPAMDTFSELRHTPNGAQNLFLFSFSAWLMALQQVQFSELKHTLHKAQDFRGWPKDVSAQGSVQRVEAHAPQGAELTTLVLARSESSRRSGQFRNCYLKTKRYP